MKKQRPLGLFLGFGLAPLWFAIFAVVAGGQGSYVSVDYWNTAPWLIVLAMPMCAVTLVIAAVFGVSPGTSWRKQILTVLVFVGLVGGFVAAIRMKANHDRKVAYAAQAGPRAQEDVLETARAVQRAQASAAATLALHFVQEDRSVLQATGGSQSFLLESTTRSPAGLERFRFHYIAAKLYVIVDDTGTPDNPVFNLACTTAQLPSEAQGAVDECEDANRATADRH